MATSKFDLGQLVLMVEALMQETTEAKKNHVSNMDKKTRLCLTCAVEILLISVNSPCAVEQQTAIAVLLEPFAEYWQPYSELGGIDRKWAFESWPLGKTWIEIFRAEKIQIESNSLVDLSGILKSVIS